MADQKSETDHGTPSWLDREFIQRALRTGDANPTLVVTSCDIKVSVGDGYSSNMYTITAKIQGSQDRQLIVKAHPHGDLREELLKKHRVFDIETRMLTETLPAMNKILQQINPDQHQPLGPKCLYHGHDPVQFIVMEDLRQSGFTMAKRHQGLDLPHCSLAIRTLARFHASSLALHDQDPAAIEWYDKNDIFSATKPEDGAFHNQRFACLIDEVSKWAGYEKYGNELNNMKETFFERSIEIYKRKENEFNVIIHGDCWTNNMMFSYSDQEVQGIRFLDFQAICYTSPALDLHYFFYTCPSEDVRINHMQDLIQEYHNTLVEILSPSGYSGRIITLPELQETFKRYAFYGFVSAACMLPIVLSKMEDGFNLDDALKAADGGVGESKNICSNAAYVKIMKRLLPVFEEQGVFD